MEVKKMRPRSLVKNNTFYIFVCGASHGVTAISKFNNCLFSIQHETNEIFLIN